MAICTCTEEIERCREAVKQKLQQRQSQVSDLNEVQALLCKLESVFQVSSTGPKSFFTPRSIR